MHATNDGERELAVPFPSSLSAGGCEIRSILAVTDLSRPGGWAVERAAQLAAPLGASLTLMVAATDGEAPPPDAAGLLARHARQLSRRFQFTVRTARQTANALAHVVEEAHCTDLLVIGDSRESALAAFLRGSTAERLARACRCPVLVVKQPATGRYARILVPVDLSGESKQLVGLACRLDGAAEIQLFHAIGTREEAKLRSAEASAQQVRAFREACLRDARQRLLVLGDSFDARRNRVRTAIGLGDPARQAVVQQEYLGADLVVVGRRRRSPIADFFLGNVAQRVLRWASSDVLIAPRDVRAATGAAARRRLDADGMRRPAQARWPLGSR